MPESRVALFLSVDICMTMLTLGLVALRIIYRWANRRLVISDYLICAAMTASLIHMTLDIIITVHFGYARHQKDLPPDLQGSWKTNLMFWLIQIFTKFPLMLSKLSLCCVYRDLLRYVDLPAARISRIINYTLITVLTGFFTAATFVGIFSCHPIDKSWFPAKPGHCIDTQIMFNYVTSSINISTSVLLIYIPLPVLYLAKNKRIEVKQLFALVLLGLIDTVISAVRLYMISDLRGVKRDFTWLIIPTHLVIVVEFNVTIIAASLVIMRPCFQAIFNLLFPNSRYNSNNAKSFSFRPSRYKSGYIMSPSEAAKQAETDIPGITKTVDIELASRTMSTEEILKESNAQRTETDRPEWHERHEEQ